MLNFKTHIDNKNYLLFDGIITLSCLMADDEIPDNIKNIAGTIFSDIFEYERNNRLEHISDIAIRKDSILGKFLIERASEFKFCNKDLIVSYEKVVNAFNIAIYENNAIAKEILPLFRNKVSGIKEKLQKEYGFEIIEYILNNDDFYYYLEVIEGKYNPQEYFVYENGIISKRILLEDLKILKK